MSEHGSDPTEATRPEDEEVLDGEVLPARSGAEVEAIAAVHELAPARWIASPAVQTAAAAATGFLAGAATLALLRRHSLRSVARQVADMRQTPGAVRPRGEPLRFAPGHTYLVRVHVLSTTTRPPE